MKLATARIAFGAFRRAFSRSRTPANLERHLDAAYQWLCAAQDATPDGGVAGCYNLFRRWTGSYPETTGYIIPTFLHYGVARENPSAHGRAIRMADWETDIQLASGAMRNGLASRSTGPSIFNTGQVIFGWIAAYQATDDDRYARAAASAARWLVSVQDHDGAWRKYISNPLTNSSPTYNARSAWGLALAGSELNETRWTSAAMKNCDWVLSRQNRNGWFSVTGGYGGQYPMLHSIAYILEGLLGVGELLGRERYIHAAMAGVEPLTEIFRKTGSLHGRYDSEWQPRASWRSPNGEAQVAIVLERLANITGETHYSEVSQALLEGVAGLQDLHSRYPETYGSVPASKPLWGGYGAFSYLNWSAKFLLDGLMLNLLKVDVQAPLRTPAAIPAMHAA
jgi:uncharacterized protein YyaL (SSP411 family)